MGTLFETWTEHERELEKLLDGLVDMDEDVRHKFRLFQVKCQRDELRAIRNDLKRNDLKKNELKN